MRARPRPGRRLRSPPGSGPPSARQPSCRARARWSRAASPGRIHRGGDGANTFLVAPRSASARDGRNDGQLVAFLEQGGETLAVADVLVVAEEVHVAAQGALVVEETVLEARELARQLLERRLHG